MSLSERQLKQIVAHGLPYERLVEALPLGERTYQLDLGERNGAILRLPGPPDLGAGDPLAAEFAALEALKGEIDLALPQVLAHDLDGASGTPYLIVGNLEGMSLIEAVGTMVEEQRYELGRALGAMLARVHSYSAAAYGALDPAAPPAIQPDAPVSRDDDGEPLSDAGDEDVRYMLARLDNAAHLALADGSLDADGEERIRAWARENVAPTGRPAALVHGDLRPHRIIVRRRERRWVLGGLTGWGFAQGWRPAWDHAAMQEQFAGPEYFGLRVGYGNAYDETTERRYDQLREFALRPYRMVLFLEAGRADLALALTQTAQEEGQ